MEKENQAEYREFVIRAAHVWIAGGFLLVLCVTFFFLGRWYERSISFYSSDQNRIERESPGQNIPHGAVNSEDLGESLTFFDKLPKESPSDVRSKMEEIASADAKKKSLTPDEKKASPTAKAAKGSYAVQVLSSKDKASAQKVRDKLSKSGYQCFIHKEKGTSGTVYKVRVGSCATTGEAQKLAEALMKQRYSTWVVRID